MLKAIPLAIDDLYGLQGKQPWHVREINSIIRAKKAEDLAKKLAQIEQFKRSQIEEITFPAHAGARVAHLPLQTLNPYGDSIHPNAIHLPPGF